MEPQDIPLIICGSLCLVPFLVGLTGFFIPFIFAKRLPVLKASRWLQKSRKVTQLELSLESRESVREMRKAKKEERNNE
jgi:hypothetical protein